MPYNTSMLSTQPYGVGTVSVRSAVSAAWRHDEPSTSPPAFVTPTTQMLLLHPWTFWTHT